ncbi:MAG: sigma-E factor negative regulatory protein, partial [Burkholderiales bacterium]
MNERISALMDGEVDDQAAGELIQTLGGSREALDTWRVYHLISDALRESQPLPQPVVVPAQPRRWVALPIAASLAAVGLVGWLAFAPQQEPQPLVAQVPAATAPVAQAKAPALMIPLPSATGDYLLAHQGFSPRVSFQGMA